MIFKFYMNLFGYHSSSQRFFVAIQILMVNR